MALKGFKVLELAGLAPAPFCGMVLADFGAKVIRIDKLHDNTDLDCLGNGKQSISLNLKHPKGVDIVRKLCKTSDVLIEPFRAGVMEKLGLGPEVLLQDNPRLVYARLTGYGQTGCYSTNAGHDINYLALSGLLSLFGRQHENPIAPTNLVADFGGGGLMCALGILLALLERSTSGLGQVVDSSMTHGAAYLGSWLYRSQKLPIWGQERGQNLLDTGAHFYEVYKTKDGRYMSVGALEPQFYNRLLEGLELSEEEAPQLCDSVKTEQLKRLFATKFSEKTQEEWCRVFDSTDACVAPVLSLEQAPKHPHNLQEGSFIEAEDGFAPNPAPKLGRTPGRSNSTSKPPRHGQHTEEILRSLGFNSGNIREFEAEGVVKCSKASKKSEKTEMDLLQSILNTCGADKYIENFRSNGIDAFTLKILNNEDLKIIGVEEADVRNSIVKHVANLQIPSERKVKVVVDRKYALIVLNTMSMQLNKHFANLTYALKREDVDLCDIRVAPAVECLQGCLTSLEKRLTEFDAKVFKQNRSKRKLQILFPTIAVTALLLFLSGRYFGCLRR
ncbi:hypothetical protein NQ315_006233 [Exocentrus adspersus]|uniref:SAM domain-containing protein n=1 Tax=Exocentrus adspersus TaxID=1586481 RepID=A0AAV8VZK8_9CUCU|nr:hypothetical protein NQ315_006233 [Exocentrus adspersus]